MKTTADYILGIALTIALSSFSVQAQDDSSTFKQLSAEMDSLLAELEQQRNVLAVIGTEVANRSALADFLRKEYAGTDVIVVEDHASVIVQLPALTFTSGRYSIPAQARKLIAPVCQASIEFGSQFDLLIEGRADKSPVRHSGRFRDNWDVGYARARSVYEALAASRIPEENLIVATRGDNIPLNDSISKQQNRRVDFVFQPRRGVRPELLMPSEKLQVESNAPKDSASATKSAQHDKPQKKEGQAATVTQNANPTRPDASQEVNAPLIPRAPVEQPRQPIHTASVSSKDIPPLPPLPGLSQYKEQPDEPSTSTRSLRGLHTIDY